MKKYHANTFCIFDMYYDIWNMYHYSILKSTLEYHIDHTWISVALHISKYVEPLFYFAKVLRGLWANLLMDLSCHYAYGR